MNIYWQDIDIKPVDGDPAAVRALATTFRSVEDRSRTVAQRLSSIASALGPHLWTGPGADAFAHVATGIQPLATQLADSHGEANATLTDYASALESAQDAVERAAEAETRAMQDRDVARADRAAAEVDIAEQVRAQTAARLEIKECDSLRIIYYFDSAYVAQLVEYENDVRLRLAVASNQEYQARGYRDAAVSAEQDAEFQMALARGSADDAHKSRDQAAIVCVKRLHALVPAHAELPEIITQILRVGGLPGLVDFVGGSSPVLKFISGLENLPFLKDVFKFLDVASVAADIYALYLDYESARRHWQEHDYLGAMTDGMDGIGTVLKDLGSHLKNPELYLAGVAVSLAADDIKTIRDIDVNDMPSLDDLWTYGPSSFLDSLETITGDLT